ncbi:MAG: tRNA lysidine(34) synthetase TilS [Verrucomicrobia bacterium]|nr:tRNA lysidine(34) synthetase TilS [Verrucomicrobiota bacterium]MCG2681502.1 tRNA lysidine(34) synthetase TilS [Kiritimatiellia bacterium]MBU4248266.1 tRNA lysidine(34) synthetase TilS [Verrucomicrobiota bacterium]MBU4289882.1 tRNA lysidine(34) synthetase TilS [Verrucomicrobiota bacterium]MBU4428181.1 tRNA lysidine(34) synthetase TilS [Verrucomicrobiota bacterium]
MIIDNVKAAIRRHDLFRPGQHILVGVSGGADSIALLAILRDLAPAWKLRLTAAHLNHLIRGKAAAEDARFVRAFARQLGVSFIEDHKDVPRLARKRGISLEMAGREARYTFFADAAKRRHCNAVATAHTTDDQAETILMKLARGAGAQGLTGIPYVTRRGNLNITRPLRDISRAAILQFLRRRRLTWREDATNADGAYLRNRVRHEVLPFLEAKLNPRIRQALGRMAEILDKENAWLDMLSRDILSECTGSKPTTQVLDKSLKKLSATMKRVPPHTDIGGPRSVVAVPQRVLQYALDGRILASQPQAARRRVLRLWLVENGLAPESLDFDAVDRLDKLLMSRQIGRAVTLPKGRVVRKECYSLCFDSEKKPVSDPFCVPLTIPGETLLPNHELRILASLASGIQKPKPDGIGHYPARASLAVSAWHRRRIIVRSWNPGDRMAPLGLAGSKKVQDIFTDGKVPRDQRRQVPIFECGGEIIWIPGYRIARGWNVANENDKALQLTVE